MFPLTSYLSLIVGLCSSSTIWLRLSRRAMKILIFVKIIHELDYFCAVYMSAVYLDILKDRLYTFRADSPLRRGSQTVLFDIVVALTKLMAPILSFTAEEIWRTLATQLGRHARSEQCPSERSFRRPSPNGRMPSSLSDGSSC